MSARPIRAAIQRCLPQGIRVAVVSRCRSRGAPLLLSVVALGLALTLGLGFAGLLEVALAYDDSACRSAPVSWTNDPCADRQWGLTQVQAPQAWGVTRGAGITVAVVDTGVDFAHPDLAANLIAVPGSDLIKNTAYVCPFQKAGKRAKTASAIAQDDHGHGTHVAGILAAVAGNAIGVVGVAPDAKVLPVKVLDRNGTGSDDRVAAGICFAADKGAKVINLSLGYDPVASIVIHTLDLSVVDNAITYAYDKGAAVIIAAGNETFPACDFPASFTQALCVGAVDGNDLKAWYSNFGLNLGVVAPGGAGSPFCADDLDVWSTIWPGSGLNCQHTGYDTLAGTSMAAPHVSAVAAMEVPARVS